MYDMFFKRFNEVLEQDDMNLIGFNCASFYMYGLSLPDDPLNNALLRVGYFYLFSLYGNKIFTTSLHEGRGGGASKALGDTVWTKVVRRVGAPDDHPELTKIFLRLKDLTGEEFKRELMLFKLSV